MHHYPDLGSDASSVWNFCTHFSDVKTVWNFCARFSDVIWRETSGSIAKCRLFSQAGQVNILIQDIIQASCVYFYLYELFMTGLPLWHTSKHDISTKNMFYSPPPPPKKIVILHPYLPITATSPQWPLSSVPRVAIAERFDCIVSTYL